MVLIRAAAGSYWTVAVVNIYVNDKTWNTTGMTNLDLENGRKNKTLI